MHVDKRTDDAGPDAPDVRPAGSKDSLVTALSDVALLLAIVGLIVLTISAMHRW